MPTLARTGLGWNKDLGIPSRSPIWVEKTTCSITCCLPGCVSLESQNWKCSQDSNPCLLRVNASISIRWYAWLLTFQSKISTTMGAKVKSVPIYDVSTTSGGLACYILCCFSTSTAKVITTLKIVCASFLTRLKKVWSRSSHWTYTHKPLQHKF